MYDRTPTRPNRHKITFEDTGETRYAEIVRADEPTNAGSKINKALLLTDETAALKGLYGDLATPNNMFKALAESGGGSGLSDSVIDFILRLLGGETFTYTTQEVKSSSIITVPNNVHIAQVHLLGGGGGAGIIPDSYITGLPYSDSTSTFELNSKGYMGGGGGYTYTRYIAVEPKETLNCNVGEGGAEGENGGTSSIIRGDAILAQALGGYSGNNGGNGGSGGGGGYYRVNTSISGFAPSVVAQAGAKGGTNGSDGSNSVYMPAPHIIQAKGGKGQGRTTRDFGETNGTLRGSGGNGQGVDNDENPQNTGVANYGTGGSGGYSESEYRYKAGSSGIIIIRWMQNT